MADLSDAYTALQQADAAGDTAGAQKLADYIRSQSGPTQTGSTQPQASGMDNFLRQTALTGKAASEGVVGALTAPITSGPIGQAPLFIARQLGYKGLDPSQWFSQLLNAGGAPTPDTSGEQLASAATRGVTGALSGGGIMGLTGLPNAVRAGTAGFTGGVSAEAARQMGLPPWAQFGAGLIGGQTPALLESGAQTVGHLVAPLTESGQSRMAGIVLNEQAANPGAAITRLEGAKPIVPGSMPTMGPASGDLGLMGMEKGLKSSNPVPFGQRISAQNTAQQNELSDLAGSPGDLSTAIKERSSTVQPLYAAAAKDSAPIDNEMIALMQRPSMQTAIAKAQQLAQEKGQTFGMSSTAPGGPMSLSGQDLQGIKMALDDMKTTAFTQGIGSHQANAMQDTLDSLKDWMQRNVPSQRAADVTFQAASGPINRMEALQELQQKSGTTAVDVNTRLPFLSSARFTGAFSKLQENPFNGTSPKDLTRLQAIQKDLQNQQAINGPMLKASGSDTFQNFSINQNMLGAGGVGRFAMKPLDFIYQKMGVDRSVNEILTNAALNPQSAASLMRKGAAPSSQYDMYRVGNAYDVGTFFGLSGLAQ